MRRYQRGGARHGAPGRAEIIRAVPGRSRRLRGARIEKQYLDALTVQPELGELRAVARANTLKVAAQLARHASYEDGTTRPTRARVCKLARVCESAWKAARRRLEAWGFLGTVVKGTTPEFSPMALADPDAPNTAAVYIICVPKDRPSPQVSHQTRPPTRSRRDRVRQPQQNQLCKTRENRKDRPAAGLIPGPRPRRPRAVVAAMRKAAGYPVSEEWCARLTCRFVAAGYSAADLAWAVDHEPGGAEHWYTDDARHPVGRLRWRLGRWRDEHGRPVLSRSQQLAVSRQRTRASRDRDRGLFGDRSRELAQHLEQTAAAVAAARAAQPSPRSAELSRRLKQPSSE
jgi:hypothetical protein